jgi:hypothetical protein
MKWNGGLVVGLGADDAHHRGGMGEERHFEPVGFEEATTRALELSAFAAARDGAEARRNGLPWPPACNRLGRVRKFGRRHRR